MKPLIISYRLLALVLLSASGLVLMGIYGGRKAGDPVNQKQKNIRQWWLKKVIKIVGLKLTTMGEIPTESQSALWVSNHVSWLDIPVVGSEGAAFLAKAEIRKWPVIGWLGEKGGTVYIKRGGKNASQLASEKIAENIQSGDNVLVFPEATTTDGRDVKRFHARIFAPALDHDLSVQPIAVRYLDASGSHHPNVVWGDESFLANVFKILGENSIHVELHFLPVLQGAEYSQRKHLTEQAHQQIKRVVAVDKKYTPPLS